MLPASFDGRRLQRRWWTTSITLTLGLLAAYYACFWLPIAIQYPVDALYYAPEIFFDIITSGGPAPPAIAAFLGLCGLGWGSRYTKSAQETLARTFGLNDLPESHAVCRRVHAMADRLGLPRPRVALMTEANAYAIGKSQKDAAVVIGIPLLQKLTPEELDAVIGHELGHIVSGDMRRMQLAEGYQSMCVEMVSNFARILVAAFARTRMGAAFGNLFGLLGRVTVFAGSELAVKRLSRKREYFADAVGAMLTSPAAMKSALEKIHEAPMPKVTVDRRYASLMFRAGRGGRLLATHPTLERRVRALDKGHYVQKLVDRGCGRSRSTRYGKAAGMFGVRAAVFSFQTSCAAARMVPWATCGAAVADFIDRNLYLWCMMGLATGLIVTLMVVA